MLVSALLSDQNFQLQWSVASPNGELFPTGQSLDYEFVPLDDGIYTVTLTATDGNESFTTSTFIPVNNVAPRIEASGPPAVDEGAEYVLSLGEVTDPGDDVVVQYVVNWGDGGIESFDTPGDVAHIYADGDRTRTILVNLIDEDGVHKAAAIRSVAVRDIAPAITLLGAATVDEADTYSLTLSTVFDPGRDTVSEYRVHWGDGVTESFELAGDIEHVYAVGNVMRTIVVDLVDEDGLHEMAGALNVAVTSPSLTIELGGPFTTDEGSSYTLHLGAVQGTGANTASEFIVHWGDGTNHTTTMAGDVTHTYPDGDFTHTILVDLVDEAGVHQDAGKLAVTVVNVAPTIELSGPSSVDEGATFTLTLGAVTDPGQDAVTEFIVDWGDGVEERFAAAGAVTHRYDDGQSGRQIVVDLIDEDGRHDQAGAWNVLINNVSPTIQLSGPDAVDEGAPYTLTLGPVSDPGQDNISGYIVYWGDGFTDSYEVAGEVTHAYSDGGDAVAIRVDLIDEDSVHSSAGTLNVAVNNVPPTIAVGGTAAVDEGTTYRLTLGNVVDPGADTVFEYIVDWGDGSQDSVNAIGDIAHTYADGPASFTIAVDLLDEDGLHENAGALGLSVNNVAPSLELSGAATVAEGSPYVLTLGAINDPGDDTVSQFIVHWSDEVSETFDSAGAVAHTYFDGDFTHTIRVEVVDEDGRHLAGTQVVTVNDVSPAIVVHGPPSVDEGTAYSLSFGQVIDPGDNDVVVEYIVNWGDGSVTRTSEPSDQTHVFADGDAARTIRIDLVEEGNKTHVGAGGISVMVNNLPPELAVVGDQSLDGNTLTLVDLGLFTDPGFANPNEPFGATVEQFSFAIDWGDGSPTDQGVADIDQPGSPGVPTSGSFDGSHAYADDGEYTVTVSIRDDDGGADANTFVVMIGAPPTVTDVQVNGGIPDPPDRPTGKQPTTWLTQHSAISSLVVTFSKDVVATADDFILTNLGLNAPLDSDTIVPLSDDQLSVSGNVVTIHVASNQLAEGVCRLEVLPTVVGLLGSPLDGNGDGRGGDAFVYQGDAQNKFYKLTADWNGDLGVSIFDFGTFTYWFGQPAAPEYVDLNGDGGISIFDFPEFSRNFGARVVFPAAVSAALASGGQSVGSPEKPEPRRLRGERAAADLAPRTNREQAMLFLLEDWSRDENMVKTNRPGSSGMRDEMDRAELNLPDLEQILDEIGGEVFRGWRRS